MFVQSADPKIRRAMEAAHVARSRAMVNVWGWLFHKSSR